MGMGALDLCLRLEKQFGVKISHQEGYAVLFDTPGAIHRYLMAKLRGEYQKAPDIESLVLKVYKSVNRITGWWRLTSSTDLNKRFAPAKREACWQSLEKELGISLPKLDHPPDEGFPEIPRQCDSVMSLTNWIIEHYPDCVEWLPVSCERSGETAEHEWTEEEVWEILRECIVGALGVKPKDVTRDAQMIKDLGVD